LRQNLQKNRSELQIPRHSAEAEPGTTFYARAVSGQISTDPLHNHTDDNIKKLTFYNFRSNFV
jgi:hypothetical protein